MFVHPIKTFSHFFPFESRPTDSFGFIRLGLRDLCLQCSIKQFIYISHGETGCGKKKKCTSSTCHQTPEHLNINMWEFCIKRVHK